MFDDTRSFVSRPFLRSELDLDYRAYDDEQDAQLLTRLRAWAERRQLSETQAEGAFTQTFMVETWGYGEAGRVARDEVTLIPKLRISGEGAGGGPGEADVSLGWFRDDPDAIPQVLCEYKDIRSDLDARQNRKGSQRSPVTQALNYVRGARRGLFGNEPVQPWWALVTDMNEFRLYWWDRAPGQYLRFIIKPRDLLDGAGLLGPGADARFDRFLFWKLFQRDFLISEGGRPALLRLIERQWVQEKALEGVFYERYRTFRERLFGVLRVSNPGFPGTMTELLRVTQKLVDRFIFALYCEDMGERMLFPPNLIRDYLRHRSTEDFYDSMGGELWGWFRSMFRHMNDGGEWNRLRMPHINGGLFAPDAQIDGLDIPNHIFAATNQGASEDELERHHDTLLYLSARYNYASRGDARESLSLYTLGRIFEQSITELEYRAGELEGRPSVAQLSRRKRDGVYYTPERIVNYLVGCVLEPWFASARAASGWPADGAPDAAAVTAYEAKLRAMRIVDPACGSGAFLISAFRRLLDERVEVEREKVRLAARLQARINPAPLTADILARNIYGVDLNPASVEIAKLALWLHSARADAPLSSLDHTLRCGNSLVGPDFWQGRADDPTRRERINAFDWKAAFPEVWPEGTEAEGGFDIVLGNPPYVKLQTLHAVDPGVAAYLQAERGPDTYQSARTGNFDLYLPFIEKGLRLLRAGGRMAYIAPSLWTVNRYGEGLRALVKRLGALERWVDFKAFQVFDEAITYTALQVFTRASQPAIRIALAPEGDIADIAWDDPALAVPYEEMPADAEWLIATGADRALIDRLAQKCLRLDGSTLTSGIVVGLQTSADAIYHLERLGPGRYRCAPSGAPAYEVGIEDVIMKPLVSGAEAKRYETPETTTYLLFPYERTASGGMRLIPQADMEVRFPAAWAHLKTWEAELRRRENGTFNDETWWRFGRNQNIDKQDIPKLIVAQTVPCMRVTQDAGGSFYLNNVRVNGILSRDGVDPSFLLGVLNGKVCDYVFRRIGKPKMGGWFEANRQFIAPLPIPNAASVDRADIAARARRLQDGWSHRRDLASAAEARLSVLPRSKHPVHWLWPDLPRPSDLEATAPRALTTANDRRDWATKRLKELVASRCEALQGQLDAGAAWEATFRGGELRLYANGSAVVDRVFVGEDIGHLVRAHWTWLFLSRTWREADRLSAELRRPPREPGTAAADQFIARVAALAAQTTDLAAQEHAMNERLFDLYDLTITERELVSHNAGR